jgi:hypothetical protein
MQMLLSYAELDAGILNSEFVRHCMPVWHSSLLASFSCPLYYCYKAIVCSCSQLSPSYPVATGSDLLYFHARPHESHQAEQAPTGNGAHATIDPCARPVQILEALSLQYATATRAACKHTKTQHSHTHADSRADSGFVRCQGDKDDGRQRNVDSGKEAQEHGFDDQGRGRMDRDEGENESAGDQSACVIKLALHCFFGICDEDEVHDRENMYVPGMTVFNGPV